MIPAFNLNGNLPPGIHPATWEEFTVRFGWNYHRNRLLTGLRRALSKLFQAGCRTAYIDGSFVTSKEVPNDYDACWETTGVDLELLKQLEFIFFDFSCGRARQKALYMGEFFPDSVREGASGRTFLEFFQTDRQGNPKGIVAIDLRSLRR